MATVACALVALVAGSPVPSALAVFSKQATVTGNTVGTATTFPACYRDAVATDTPASYWRLDETTGTTAADSAGSSPGTYRNGVSLGQSGALPDAVSNKAASFDGVDDDVQVGDVHGFAGTAAFSVEFWVNPTSANSSLWRPLVAKEDPGADWSTRQGWAIWLVPSTNVISMERWNGTTQFRVDSLTPVKAGSWSHVVATYDGSTARLYVNGTLDRSAASSLAMNAHTVPLRFGSFGTAADPWLGRYAGLLDDVAISSTALSATQVRTHYNTGRCYKDAVLADDPVGYWRLGETSGTSAADGIRGRHGTYTNGPTLNQTGGLNGDSNPSVTFDGVNDMVRVPHTGALNPAPFTVEAWARPTGGQGAYRTVVSSYQDPGPFGYGIWASPSNTWEAWIAGGGGAYTYISAPLTLNTWVHLVETYDGTTLRFYVNGLLAGSAAGTYAANPSMPLSFGGATYDGSTWQQFFPGSLDEVALYGTALSQTRIQAHYLLGRSYKDTVLDSGPVSYWRLGEATGSPAAADVKGTNPGTYKNGAVLAQPGVLAGDADTATSFDGADDYVSVPDSPSVSVTGPFTLEAWINTTSSAQQGILEKYSYPWYHGYVLRLSGGKVMAYTLGSTDAAESVTGATTVSLTTWHHVAAVFDGSTLKVYLDGVLDGSAAVTYAPDDGPDTVKIGARGDDNTLTFAGRIDDPAVYARALPAAEIKLHYDSGRQ